MSLSSHLPTTGKTIIEVSEPLIKSVPLPFASVAFSDSYHLALLRNLGVDGGMVAFSHPSESFYLASVVAFPPVSQPVEQEIARFCKLIDKGLIKTENNVIGLEAVCTHLPGFCRLNNKAGYQFIRVYRINDFLAASGYWLMFFRTRMAASQAGDVIASSLSSHQFRETITDQLFMTAHEEALDEVIRGWVTLLDKRDKETEAHTRRVADLAVRLALVLGMNEEMIKQLRRGALLHDVGKIVIPDEILYKRGPLTDSEWRIMRLHPKIVTDLLKNFHIPAEVLEIPLAHHERWDGSGYPEGLKGEEIPLSARIFSIVDVWDAMSVDRPYRPKFERCQVIDNIREQTGRHFDPRVAEVFLTLMESEQVSQ